MKHFFTFFILVCLASCSVFNKHKTQSANTTDSTHTQATQFVEYHQKDSLGNFLNLDSNGKVAHDTWQATTHIIELFDSSGKITTRTTHQVASGQGTTQEKQVSKQQQQTDLHQLDTSSKKKITTDSHHQATTNTQVNRKTKINTLPWWLLVLAGIAVVVWIECPQLYTFFLALFKRKKQQP